MTDLRLLQRRLNFEFADVQLLETAVTHRSHSANNNERFEFLGDALLDFVIGEVIFERYQDAPEGDLSRVRASLVKKETLAKLAKTLELGRFMNLGAGELKSGGFRRESILADAMEAIFCAAYLDAGFDAARQMIIDLYRPLIEQVQSVDDLKDPKTRLQEYLQSRKLELPVYDLVACDGEAHEVQTFKVLCRVTSLDSTVEGTGGSRRKAEQDAAQAALALVKEQRSVSI